MYSESGWKQTRGKLARKSQDLPKDHPDLQQLRAELREKRTAEFIQKQLAVWPPLTPEQLNRLAELLKPVQITPADIEGGGTA